MGYSCISCQLDQASRDLRIDVDKCLLRRWRWRCTHSIKEGITWKYAIRSSRAIIQTMQIQMLLLLEITRYYLEVSVRVFLAIFVCNHPCSKQLVINHKRVINSHNANKELWLHISIEDELSYKSEFIPQTFECTGQAVHGLRFVNINL